MRSAEQPASADAAEYRVCLLDEQRPAFREWRTAGVGTLLVHSALILILMAVPREETAPREPERQRVTPLIDPLTRLTQKAPNRAPLSQQISIPSETPAPRVAKPAETRRRFQAPPPVPNASQPKAAPRLAQEPPKILAQAQPGLQIPAQIPATPPPPRTVEQPKLVLEAPPPPPQSGPGTGRLKVPGSGIEDIVHDMAHSSGGSRAVGDDTNEEPPDRSLNAMLAPKRPKSSVELVSDPKGVDFRPYLLQVLGTVRRNWFTVMPESVHLGQQRGRVVLQFSVARDGTITKVVYSTESGSQTLDRAAVAALSMSNRLPPLPPDFKEDRVALQFTFLYNTR